MRQRTAPCFVSVPAVALVLFGLISALGVCSAQDLSLKFQSEFWYGDIDYDPPESRTRDGDISLLSQRLDIGFPGKDLGGMWNGTGSDTTLGFKVALGIEEYAQGNHTDIQQYRVELRRQFYSSQQPWDSERGHPCHSFGLGFNFWNNDYSSNNDSNEEFGPTILFGAQTDTGNLRATFDLVWQPVDLGDSGEFEFYELDGSLVRDFRRFDIELGYRMKNYYESRDDYLYHGPFIRGGFNF